MKRGEIKADLKLCSKIFWLVSVYRRRCGEVQCAVASKAPSANRIPHANDRCAVLIRDASDVEFPPGNWPGGEMKVAAIYRVL
jgi:hypothetical protein